MKLKAISYLIDLRIRVSGYAVCRVKLVLKMTSSRQMVSHILPRFIETILKHIIIGMFN